MLPEPIRVSERGSFAEHTIITRKPEIIRQVIESNDYDAGTIQALRRFVQEIATKVARPPIVKTDDLEQWQIEWSRFEGQTWLELEWYFAEAFFYRRLLETVGYYRGKYKGHDPFASAKRAALDQGLGVLGRFLAQPEPDKLELQFTRRLHRSLWGNRVDLSNLLVEQQGQHDLAYEDSQWLLIDHSDTIWRRLSDANTQRLDLVADNSGLELLSDLELVSWLLRHKIVDVVYLHLKRDPFFVSDARITDLESTIQVMGQANQPALNALSGDLRELRAEGRLIVQDDPFWNSPAHFARMPGNLRQMLDTSDLILFKGDANYRRLVEDRHWPHETPLSLVADHMPHPLAALRTVKSELILGLTPGQAEATEKKDPRWMLNGRWGVIDWVA